MELRHLRYFVAVAEELHFTHAAVRLNMAQPPLSHQIGQLEKELGVVLFWRTKRKVELTEAGIAFLDEARRTLAQADQATRVARLVQAGQIGKLSLGFVDTALHTVLPELLRLHRSRYPTIQVIVRQLPPSQQIQALLTGDIQVGLLRKERVGRELVFEDLIHERLVLAVPRSHPMARPGPIRLRDVEGEAFVMFPPALAPALHDFIHGLFRKAGVVPRIAQEAAEAHTRIGLVAAGVGLSVTTEAWSNWAPNDVVYRPIEDANASLPLSIAWRRTDRSPVVKVFIDLAREVAAATRLRSNSAPLSDSTARPLSRLLPKAART